MMRFLRLVLSVLLGAALVQSSEVCSWEDKMRFNHIWDNHTLTICCKTFRLSSSLLDETVRGTAPAAVRLVGCRAPTTSIAAVLRDSDIALPRSLTVTGVMDITQPRIFAELENLLDLTLSGAELLLVHTIPAKFFMETFSSLQTLHLIGIILPSNLITPVSELTLEMMTIDTKIYCRNLRVLKLRSVRLLKLQSVFIYLKNGTFSEEPWLNNCESLENVTIDDVKDLEKVFLFLHGTCLRYLSMNHCDVQYKWPPSWQLLNKTKLEGLDLSWNEISFVRPKDFESRNHFGDPDIILEDNKIGTTVLQDLPKSLKKLSLAHNNLSSLCFQGVLNEWASDGKTIREGNNAHKECIRLHSGVRLLNLSHNLFTELEFQGILDIGSQNIEIDLRGNLLDNIHFDKKEYTKLANRVKEKNTNITLLVDWLDCECHHGWLVQATRDISSFVITALCQYLGIQTTLKSAPREFFECTKSQCYPGCSCITMWHDNTTTLTCNGLTSMPYNVSNMRAVWARSNHIKELSVKELPDSLEILDLSDNELSGMDAEVAGKLFSVPRRSVWLARNPLICDCRNKPFIEELRDHKKQVRDFEIIDCYYETRLQPLNNVTLDNLCADLPQADNMSTVLLVLSVIFTLLTTLSILVSLYNRYKSSIKRYLYLRGCCLFWVIEEEEEDDSEMLYDVFLSYCHKDERFVSQELLRGLEDDQTKRYKVCIHLRDWIVGEFIPKQILQSVEQSRRTLVVLSKHFAHSMWGLLEFRSALMSDVHDGRSRLIVMILDDVVNDPNLDPELKNYVRTHTFVCWDDPQFWEKLRYALPHGTKKVKKSKSNQNRKSNNASIELTNFLEANAPNLVYPRGYTE